MPIEPSDWSPELPTATGFRWVLIRGHVEPVPAYAYRYEAVLEGDDLIRTSVHSEWCAMTTRAVYAQEMVLLWGPLLLAPEGWQSAALALEAASYG